MKEDKISGFIKVVNGFKTVLLDSLLESARRNDMLLYSCGYFIPSFIEGGDLCAERAGYRCEFAVAMPSELG